MKLSISNPIKQLKRSELRRLLSYLRPYSWRMILATITLVLTTGLSLIFPWLLQNLIDVVLAEGNQTELNRITVLLIAAFFIQSILYYIQTYQLSYVGERIVVDLRQETYEHLHDLSIRYFTDQRIGELLSRLTSDVTLVRTALTNNVASVLSQSLTFIGSLILMLALNWRLTLIILVLAPAIIGFAAIFGARLRKLASLVQDRLAGSTAIAQEAFAEVRIVKAFNREPYEVDRYQNQVENTFQTTIRMTRIRALFGSIISFLGFASLAAILWYGGREVLAGNLTGGSLIAFLIYALNIGTSLGSFTGLYTQLQEAAGASERIFGILDEVPDIIDSPDAIVLPELKGQLILLDVSFAYPGAEHVLHNINLKIEPGEILALVGPSGAGKSTVFNLIPRFYDPTEGKLFVDGYDLNKVTIHSLRKQIGLVPQEVQLFSGTIRDNVLYGKLDASDNELNAAAEAANAIEFINKLTEGWDTLVGERGVKLSGGQRQRIAIARALLKNPRILLLDEATSSLDSESESLVQEALERLMVNRTTLIIAHRLSTVHKANRIAVIKEGYLVELGSHEALIAQDGIYARLYRLQFRNQADLDLSI